MYVYVYIIDIIYLTVEENIKEVTSKKVRLEVMVEVDDDGSSVFS